MAFGTPQVVVASTTQTATGASPSIGIADIGNQLNLVLNVTAASGTTPTLVASVEWSMDGTVFGVTDPAPDAFASVTATGALVHAFEVKAPFYRVRWTVGGTTPSFTFVVSAYVTP